MNWRCCRPWREVDLTHLAHQPIQLTHLFELVSAPERGGIASFVGVVRDEQEGRGVLRLEYSAFEPMAEAECARIVAEALEQWPVSVALEHRVGALVIGDIAVAVVVAAAHRGPAFEACRYLIEEVKRRLPIWKKEFYTDGSVAWVDPTARPLSATALHT